MPGPPAAWFIIRASLAWGTALWRGLNRLIVRVSANPWLFGLALLLTFASLRALLWVGAGFPALAGGAMPFDLQNGLTATEVPRQLALYTEAARHRYLLFTAVDYLFPFAAGLFLAATITFGLRHALPGVYAIAEARSLLPWLMLGTLFDWCENVAIVTAIQTWPDTTVAMAHAVVIAKRLKLACTFLGYALALVLLATTTARWLARRAWR